MPRQPFSSEANESQDNWAVSSIAQIEQSPSKDESTAHKIVVATKRAFADLPDHCLSIVSGDIKAFAVHKNPE